jgi:hypothetical protein
MWKSIAAMALAIPVLCAPTRAAILSYQASGTVSSSSGSNITVGTPFMLAFAYDNAAPGTPGTDGSESYPLMSGMHLVVDGVTIGGTTDASRNLLTFSNIGGNTPQGDLTLVEFINTANQSGQPVSPIGVNIDFKKLGVWSSVDLSHFPVLNLSDYPVNSELILFNDFFGSPVYIFNGASDVHLAKAGIVHFHITSLALFPEPSAILLAASADWCCWRFVDGGCDRTLPFGIGNAIRLGSIIGTAVVLSGSFSWAAGAGQNLSGGLFMRSPFCVRRRR